MSLFGGGYSIQKVDLSKDTPQSREFKANMEKAQAANQGYDAASVSPAPVTPTTSPTTPTLPPPAADTVQPQTSQQGDTTGGNGNNNGENSSGGGDHVNCPFCSGKTLVKKIGKTLSHIIGFIQRSFSIKIPTGVLKYIKDHTPVSKTAALKGPCKACGGKGTIPDPSKKAKAAAQQAAAKHKANAAEITKLENKLAPAGGNRHTLIQGSDLLEVGLGMNDVASYVVLEKAGRRNKQLVKHSDLSSKGAPMFFEGAECNYIQGTNPPASPGGHYFIKCSNRFSVMAGAQGIDLTTGGPVTISGGITRITGPEITIGTQTGPLSLEGEVVNIAGKSIELAPSDGDLCVRGNISSSANIRVAGATHSEHLSFVTADCVGYKAWTDESSPSDSQTGPAFYGSLAAEGQIQASLDFISHVAAIGADPEKIKNLIGPAYIQSFIDKLQNLTYQSLPFELKPTGFVLPGVTFLANIQGVGAGVTVTVETPILLNSFPHTHTLHDLKHSHSIRMPAIDCSADTSEQLRSKQAGIVDIPAPGHKSTGLIETIKTTLFAGAAYPFLAFMEPIQKTIAALNKQKAGG